MSRSSHETLEYIPPLDYSAPSLKLCKPRDFRLLQLLPNPKDGVIHCDLRVENLENWCLKYKALSYTWGPATRHELNKLPGGASNNEQRKYRIVSIAIPAQSSNTDDISLQPKRH